MSQYFVALYHLCPAMRPRISKKIYLKTFSDLKARAVIVQGETNKLFNMSGSGMSSSKTTNG